jgi:hypothetical protein
LFAADVYAPHLIEAEVVNATVDCSFIAQTVFVTVRYEDDLSGLSSASVSSRPIVRVIKIREANRNIFFLFAGRVQDEFN